MAANAVTAAAAQGRPAPNHYCALCGILTPNHSPMCESLTYQAAAASFVTSGGKLS